MTSVSLVKALEILGYDSTKHKLDLEHHLIRDPPGRTQSIKLDGSGAQDFRVGQALCLTHRLEDLSCQCRHDLTTRERIERGITPNEARNGRCPLNFTIDQRVSGFGVGPTRISLASRGIEDNAVKILVAAMRENRTLTELSLEHNSIGNPGAAQLADFLGGRHNLVDLDLGKNKIGDSGASALAGALARNSTLLELSLDGNPIRPAGIQALLQVAGGQAAAGQRLCHVTLPVFQPVNTAASGLFFA